MLAMGTFLKLWNFLVSIMEGTVKIIFVEWRKKEKATALENNRCSSRREGKKFENREFMGPYLMKRRKAQHTRKTLV